MPELDWGADTGDVPGDGCPPPPVHPPSSEGHDQTQTRWRTKVSFIPGRGVPAHTLFIPLAAQETVPLVFPGSSAPLRASYPDLQLAHP